MQISYPWFLTWTLVGLFLTLGKAYAQGGCTGTPVDKVVEAALPIKVNNDKEGISPSQKKFKVVILTSSSGGGHISAANAVKAALGTESYEVSVLDILKGRIQGEELFDQYFSQEKWNKLWATVKMQPVAEQYISLWHKSDIAQIIKKEGPDLIVSVFPVANYVYKSIADELGVPMIVIPTDLDPLGFVNGIANGNKDEDDFQINLALPDKKAIEKLEAQGIKKYSIIGYPIRKEMEDAAVLYRRKDPAYLQKLDELKKTYGISSEDKVVLISMGAKAFGQKTIEEYVQTIVDSQNELLQGNGDGSKVHIILAAGSNKDLLDKMKTTAVDLAQPGARVVLHPEGWMSGPMMAERMSISNVLFLKPGGSTVAEAMAMGKRVLFKSDSTQALPWEKYNLDYMVGQKWADALNYTTPEGIDKNDFVAKLGHGLNAPPIEEKNLPQENHFSQNIRKVMDQTMVRREEKLTKKKGMNKEEEKSGPISAPSYLRWLY